MNRFSSLLQRVGLLMFVSVITMVLGACEGDRGPAGASATVAPSSASSLSMTIDRVTVASPPTVTFSVADQDGIGVRGLTTDDLRFTIAKLMPGSLGNPSRWQSYILTTQTASASGAPGNGNTALQATRENDGTLVDNRDGSYSYTFATDITDVTCPSPCTDADGNTLDVSYQATLTHRLAIQTRGSLPMVNAVYTFQPSTGATSGLAARDIVSTDTCNECHNELEVHDARIEVGYCVTCHNPGSTDPDSGNTVDFKVMIHKIHRGEHLPSVTGPDGIYGDDPDTPLIDESADDGEYAIWGFMNSKHDYSTVIFPQDIRNCSKCHDGSDADTPQGDNWQTQVSMEACGSCHDDVDFSVDPPAANAHAGGRQTSNELCYGCHSTDGIQAGSVASSHFLQEPVERQKFKLNILEICGVAVGSDPGPVCPPGSNPSVKFSISDPTNNDAEYNLSTTPEITNSNLSFLVAWDTDDYNNTDGTGSRPARADSIDFDEVGYVDDGLTRRTVTASFVIPNGGGATGYTASGSGAIGAQGRLAGDFNGDNTRARSERIYVKNEVAFFRITDATVQERRPTVSNEKCNQCHDQVSFHGGSRSGEYGVCILCHNPNNTDIAARNDPGASLPAPDGKVEESIDLRRMIHGIHAGAQTLYDSSPGHGFREQGLVVYGYQGSTHDYSHVRFPGILNDCETCHVEDAYLLDGDWASPTANGILSSTITTDNGTDPTWVDPADDLNISPTAAVCSACHDSAVARAHMEVPGGAEFSATQSVINSSVVETCSVCHGPGASADVEVVHGVD